jgi:hypothetical protein
LFQSILVTQFHHPPSPPGTGRGGGGDGRPDENDDDDDDDAKDESFDPPWPKEHEAFCAHPTVQEHVVLEIAAGFDTNGRTVSPPMDVPKGRVRVVLPGSLRERGEFCLIDVAFMRDGSAAITPTAVPTGNGEVRTSTTAASPTANGTPKTMSPALPSGPATATSNLGNYRWMVRQTRFHCLNDFV